MSGNEWDGHPPPALHEGGGEERIPRRPKGVDVPFMDLVEVRLARRRLAELNSTLFHPGAQFVDDVLERLEQWLDQ